MAGAVNHDDASPYLRNSSCSRLTSSPSRAKWYRASDESRKCGSSEDRTYGEWVEATICMSTSPRNSPILRIAGSIVRCQNGCRWASTSSTTQDDTTNRLHLQEVRKPLVLHPSPHDHVGERKRSSDASRDVQDRNLPVRMADHGNRTRVAGLAPRFAETRVRQGRREINRPELSSRSEKASTSDVCQLTQSRISPSMSLRFPSQT